MRKFPSLNKSSVWAEPLPSMGKETLPTFTIVRRSCTLSNTTTTCLNRCTLTRWAKKTSPLPVPQESLFHFKTREQCPMIRQPWTRTLLCSTKPQTGDTYWRRHSRVWKDIQRFWGRVGNIKQAYLNFKSDTDQITQPMLDVQYAEEPRIWNLILQTSHTREVLSYNAFVKESKQKMNARKRMAQEESKDQKWPGTGWGAWWKKRWIIWNQCSKQAKGWAIGNGQCPGSNGIKVLQSFQSRRGKHFQKRK